MFRVPDARRPTQSTLQAAVLNDHLAAHSRACRSKPDNSASWPEPVSPSWAGRIVRDDMYKQRQVANCAGGRGQPSGRGQGCVCLAQKNHA